MVGGQYGTTPDSYVTDTACYLNLDSGTWTIVTPYPRALKKITVKNLNGHIYVFGGVTKESTTVKHIYKLEFPYNGNWVKIGDLPTAMSQPHIIPYNF